MDPLLFVKSLLLGLAVAAPLGPIGAHCISRTLAGGFFAGLAGGLGAALADGLYAALAAIGFAALSSLLSQIDAPMRLAGGGFMLWLGWTNLRAQPTPQNAAPGAAGFARTIGATFLLTIANPLTILSFAALFAGLGLAAHASAIDIGMVVLGVVLGSILWWCVLCGGVALIRHRLPEAASRWVARLSGLVLLCFGLWAIGGGLSSLFCPTTSLSDQTRAVCAKMDH